MRDPGNEVGQIGVHFGYIDSQVSSFLCISRLELHSVERNYQSIQHWTYLLIFFLERPLPVSDHFVLHQGWSLTRELIIIITIIIIIIAI